MAENDAFGAACIYAEIFLNAWNEVFFVIYF
jgi:hypothetical protein